MATFCSKCGTSLTSDTGFCPSCGAPIGAAAPPPEVVGAAPIQPPPAAAYAQPGVAYPPPVKKSGGALKIILIIVAVVVTLGILGVAGVSFIAYRALHANGNSMSVGSNAEVTESDLGVAIYPGAVAKSNGAVRMKLGSIFTVTAGYTTPDPSSSVLAFYEDKLGPRATSREGVGGATTLTSATVTDSLKDTVVVSVTPTESGSKFTVAHTRVGGQ
jgi:hypothetical protein